MFQVRWAALSRPAWFRQVTKDSGKFQSLCRFKHSYCPIFPAQHVACFTHNAAREADIHAQTDRGCCSWHCLHRWSGCLPPPRKSTGYKHYAIGDLKTPTTGHVRRTAADGRRRPHHRRDEAGSSRRAGNGHIVILRASYGGEIGKEFFNEIGGIASAETFVFSNRKAASDPKVLESAAQGRRHLPRRRRPVELCPLLERHRGGEDPRCACRGGQADRRHQRGPRDARRGAATARWTAAASPAPRRSADPFGPAVTMEKDFLHLKLLDRVVTDTHFKERERLGPPVRLPRQGARPATPQMPAR